MRTHWLNREELRTPSLSDEGRENETIRNEAVVEIEFSTNKSSAAEILLTTA
jgi:hypothetical protein